MNNLNKLEVHNVFQKFKLGNPNAGDELFKKYHNLVTNISYTIIKDKDIAEDISQTVFLKLMQTPSDKLPNSNELSWLYSVTKNQTIDYLRKTQNNVDIDNLYDIPDSHKDLDYIVDFNSYQQMIDCLNIDEQEIVSLKILSGYTFKEIGMMLNMPTATIQWKYYKSVHTLKLLLSNMSLFLLTTIIYFINKNNNLQPIKQENSSDSSQYEQVSPSTNKASEDNYAELQPSDINTSYEQGTSTNIKQNLYHMDKEHILLGFSSIFFIFTIIFGIVYAKQKLKKHKKTSATL